MRVISCNIHWNEAYSYIFIKVIYISWLQCLTSNLNRDITLKLEIIISVLNWREMKFLYNYCLSYKPRLNCLMVWQKAMSFLYVHFPNYISRQLRLKVYPNGYVCIHNSPWKHRRYTHFSRMINQNLYVGHMLLHQDNSRKIWSV